MFFELKIKRVSLAKKKKKKRTQCPYQSGLNPSGGDSKKELSSKQEKTKISECRNRWENDNTWSSVHSNVGEATRSPTRNPAAAARSLQSCLTPCDPTDGGPPGSPVPGSLQARTLEWVCHFLLQCMKVKNESEVAQSCPILSYPMGCSPPGSSVHGIFQARVLERGAIAFSDEEH